MPFLTPLFGFVVSFLAWLFPMPVRQHAYLAIADVFSLGGTNVAWAYVCVMLLWLGVLLLKLDAAFARRDVIMDWPRRLVSVNTPDVETTYHLSSLQRLLVRIVHLPAAPGSSESSDDDTDEKCLAQIVACFPEGEAVILESDNTNASDSNTQARIESLADQLAKVTHVPLESVTTSNQEFDAAGYPRRWKYRYLPRAWRLASPRSRWFAVATIAVVLTIYGMRHRVRIERSRESSVLDLQWIRGHSVNSRISKYVNTDNQHQSHRRDARHVESHWFRDFLPHADDRSSRSLLSGFTKGLEARENRTVW